MNEFIANVQRQVQSLLPEQLLQFHGEIKLIIRSSIQNSLHELNLVTREEFDAQQAVLLRTRELLEQLEAKVDELEQQTQTTPAHSSASQHKTSTDD